MGTPTPSSALRNSRPPYNLNPYNIESIYAHMAYDFNPKVQSALIDFTQNPADIGGTMFFDTSFSGQMKDLLNGGRQPDAFAVTANSAIPVADSIRGYYETLGAEVPPIHHIEANSNDADEHLGSVARGHRPFRAFYTEAERLRSVLDDADTVCLIDQYIASGATLQYGNALLQFAGVKNVRAFRGKWYQQAKPSDIDKGNVTSSYSSDMHEIGVQACKIANRKRGFFSSIL